MAFVNATAALQRKVNEYPTQKDAAKALGISPAYLSDMVNGRRDISTRLLRKLGLKRVVTER